jgi:Transglutaminase-like superfamily
MKAAHLKEMAGVERWMGHSRMSDPADHASLIAELPSRVGALNQVVQGLLIHVDWLDAYGVGRDQLHPDARTTLPVADRLTDILAADARPLSAPRSPEWKSAGTCRDFALMLTSFLRCKGVPARLRCGFASYLGDGWEDHWICEFWHDASHAWRLSDAQIDEVMSSRVAIEFDPANVPRPSFLTAGEAWLDCRAGRSDASRFGHGEATGLWFLRLNVVRDHFALNGVETSAWDDWQDAPPATRVVSREGTDLADRLAAEPEAELTEVRPDWLEP